MDENQTTPPVPTPSLFEQAREAIRGVFGFTRAHAACLLREIGEELWPNVLAAHDPDHIAGSRQRIRALHEAACRARRLAEQEAATAAAATSEESDPDESPETEGDSAAESQAQPIPAAEVAPSDELVTAKPKRRGRKPQVEGPPEDPLA